MTRRGVAALAVVAALATSACRGGDGDGDLTAFCEQVRDSTRFETVFDDLDPSDVEAAVAAFHTAHEQQEALLDVAPDRPRADLAIVADFVDDLITGLERTAPGQERPDVYDDLRPRFAEVEAAGDRLDLYVTANC